MDYFECSKCKGTGFFPESGIYSKICPKCFGSKKLNWIENIIGKKRPRNKTYVNFPNSNNLNFQVGDFVSVNKDGKLINIIDVNYSIGVVVNIEDD